MTEPLGSTTDPSDEMVTAIARVLYRASGDTAADCDEWMTCCRDAASILAAAVPLIERRIAVEALMEARDAARANWRLTVDENDPYDEHQARHWSATAGWLKRRADRIAAGMEPDWPDAAYSAEIDARVARGETT